MAKSYRRILIPTVAARSIRALATIARRTTLGRVELGDEQLRRRVPLARFKVPRALTWRQKAARLVTADIDVDVLRPLKEFRLSVRQPHIEGAGRLYFFNVSDYVTETDRAVLFMSHLGGGSFFAITVHASRPGARYLLDISVSGPPNLRLDTVPAGASATADPAGHVLMVITAGSNRDAGIALGVIGGGMYNFHNVVISRI